VIEVEDLEILTGNEDVTRELLEKVPVEVDFGAVHGDPGRDGRMAPGRTVRNVGRPRVIVIASAIIRARHLTVTCIKVTAVTEVEAVRLVGTQKLGRVRLGQGNIVLVTVVHKFTVDTVQVHHFRVLSEVVQFIDPLEPFHVAVTHDGIPANVKLGQGPLFWERGQAERAQLQRLDLICENVDAGEVGLLEESMGLDVGDEIIIEEEHFNTIREVPTPYASDPIEGGIQRLEPEIRPPVKVAEFRDFILVEINPLELLGNESVVEPCQVIVGHVEPDEGWGLGKEVRDVGEVVGVEADCLEVGI